MSIDHILIWIACMTIGISGGAIMALLLTSLVHR